MRPASLSPLMSQVGRTDAKPMPARVRALLFDLGSVLVVDRIFGSDQIGLRKLARAAFEHLCEAIGLEPNAILFLDDLAENLQAADEAGLQAVLVRSTGDVEQALRSVGAAWDGAPLGST